MNNDMTDLEITAAIEAQIVAIADSADTDLWNESPELAARLAFAAVQLAWHEQAEAGLYQRQIPNCHGINTNDTQTIGA